MPQSERKGRPNGRARTSGEAGASYERSESHERSESSDYTVAVDLDTSLRRRIYDITLARGTPPTIAELTAATSAGERDVRSALERLATGRVIVLQRASGEILMVPPFSAVPTPFVVDSSRHSACANCAWDALGIPVLLRERARIRTACGCCGESIDLSVSPHEPPGGDDVVHFAVPAARWWEDIVFT